MNFSKAKFLIVNVNYCNFVVNLYSIHDIVNASVSTNDTS